MKDRGPDMHSGAGFYRMTPFEVATGWLTGEIPGLPLDIRQSAPPPPIRAVESLLIPALDRPPCVVAFSGGRDSSVLLAVATQLARRLGLPAPIAATLRYPGDEATWEDSWQEITIRHLGSIEWEKVRITDEADLLGPLATDALRRHGLIWPPAHHTIAPLVKLSSGGVLVTGDGGDEVFGRHRLTPLARALAGHCPRTRAEAAETALALAPRSARRVAIARALRDQMAKSWLRPATQDRFAKALAADEAREPAAWSASRQRLGRMRAWRLGFHNQDLLASYEGVRILRPFQDPMFLLSVSRRAPAWGFPDRATAMRRFFSTILPDEVLARNTKARFNAVVFGRYSRDFVARWTGGGVPGDLVDGEALMRFWSRPMPHAMSFALLQSAWLAEATPPARDSAKRRCACRAPCQWPAMPTHSRSLGRA